MFQILDSVKLIVSQMENDGCHVKKKIRKTSNEVSFVVVS